MNNATISGYVVSPPITVRIRDVDFVSLRIAVPKMQTITDIAYGKYETLSPALYDFITSFIGPPVNEVVWRSGVKVGTYVEIHGQIEYMPIPKGTTRAVILGRSIVNITNLVNAADIVLSKRRAYLKQKAEEEGKEHESM